MPSRILAAILLCGAAVSFSGCQCYRVTWLYADVIDAIADTKWKLDPLYEPGLDLSRIGMPDWQRFGINRFLCPCANGRCCPHCRGCRNVYYPAEYRMKYWAYLAEEEAEAARAGSADLDGDPELMPAPEMIPLPEPADNLPKEADDAVPKVPVPVPDAHEPIEVPVE